jgi:hypothetical protein
VKYKNTDLKIEHWVFFYKHMIVVTFRKLFVSSPQIIFTCIHSMMGRIEEQNQIRCCKFSTVVLMSYNENFAIWNSVIDISGNLISMFIFKQLISQTWLAIMNFKLFNIITIGLYLFSCYSTSLLMSISKAAFKYFLLGKIYSDEEKTCIIHG